jgi:hypothetical protein
VADKLIPKDHGFGTRRVPLESGYFETYNRDNVTLIASQLSFVCDQDHKKSVQFI